MKDYKRNISETRLYDVVFPVWLLMIFPLTWFFVLPAVFIMDALILVLGMYLFKIEKKGKFFKKNILWVFLFGFVSDLIGGIVLLVTQFFGDSGFFYEYVTLPVSQNPFDNVYSILYTVFAVAVSAVLIYVFNRFISFRKYKNIKLKRWFSLLLAVFTAPYLFLVPASGINGSQSESFTNHIVWNEFVRAELYLADNKDADVLADGKHYDYELVTALRKGINTADRCEFTHADDGWDYRIVFYKNGPEPKKLEEILMYEYGGNFYFSFEGRFYKIKNSYKEEIIKEMTSDPDTPAEEETDV